MQLHQGDVLPAQFRGCDSSGRCRFVVDAPPGSMFDVQPDGVIAPRSDSPLGRAVRDRLNALLSSMIHQHKRIELHGLRAAGDGAYAATVIVNGADVASDPILLELHAARAGGAQ